MSLFLIAMRLPTSMQLSIARQYGIPLSQAWTVSYEKYVLYCEWLKCSKCRVERVLDEIDHSRNYWLSTF